MTMTLSLKPRVKARVTQMASKLYCQLKALCKTALLGANNSIKVQSPTVLVSLVTTVSLAYYWELGYKLISEFP